MVFSKIFEHFGYAAQPSRRELDAQRRLSNRWMGLTTLRFRKPGGALLVPVFDARGHPENRRLADRHRHEASAIPEQRLTCRPRSGLLSYLMRRRCIRSESDTLRKFPDTVATSRAV